MSLLPCMFTYVHYGDISIIFEIDFCFVSSFFYSFLHYCLLYYAFLFAIQQQYWGPS